MRQASYVHCPGPYCVTDLPGLSPLRTSRAKLKLDSIRKSRKCDKCTPVRGMKISWLDKSMVSTSSTTWLSARKAKANERKRYLESLRPTYASREINRIKAEKATKKTSNNPSVTLNTDTTSLLPSFRG